MSDDKIIDYSDTHYVLHGFKSSNEAIEKLSQIHVTFCTKRSFQVQMLTKSHTIQIKLLFLSLNKTTPKQHLLFHSQSSLTA